MNNYIEFINDFNELDVKDFLIRKGMSIRQFTKSKMENAILIDGKPIGYGNKKVRNGSAVRVTLDDEVENIASENKNIDVVFEDEHLLIIDKPPYIVVHPTGGHQSGTLANRIAHYYAVNGIKRKIRFVNRLDMDTSGLIIIAKNAYAHSQLGIALENHQVIKKYLAVVCGKFEILNGTIELPLGKANDEDIKRTVIINGNNCVTHYSVVNQNDDYALVELTIPTGKSHQIRAHLAQIGHPIIGDTLYGKPSDMIGRQALHAYYIEIQHPFTGEKICLESHLPADIHELINVCKLFCGE